MYIFLIPYIANTQGLTCLLDIETKIINGEAC